ncbi:MAG: ROK family protein [Lachnospiraceae bacterium]|jgi:glucokinase|nr:ROK family protein [Lachnospiraceae bacterium]
MGENVCLGLDVGGTSVKIGLFTVDGALLDKWEVPTRTQENGKYILADVADSIKARFAQSGRAMSDLVGCGIGVPGPVMPDGYVEVCVNLGWKDAYPAKELSDLLDGVPVRCNNDANVAALGELWQGGGKGYHDLVMATLGTGVGGGIILGDKIVSGCHGLGGEIGHFRVRRDETEYCNCGGQGCLEQYASATGIVREARRALAADDRPSALRGFEATQAVAGGPTVDGASAGDGTLTVDGASAVPAAQGGEGAAGGGTLTVGDASAVPTAQGGEGAAVSAAPPLNGVLTAKDVLDAAKEGDALALEVMDDVGYYLGVAFAHLALTVDPEVIVIGGGVSKAGEFLIDIIDRHYRKSAAISERKAKLRLATLGNDAGIYGAARLILD